MINTREYNKKRFSIYESDEKTALGLMNELGQACNEVLDRTDIVEKENKKKVSYEELHNKYQLTTDGTTANFTGSWHGIKKPTASQEGLQATVDNIIDKDIPSINNRIDNLIIHSGDGSVNNAEIIDGRNGIDGTSYTLIGNNIRETTKNIYSFISGIFDFKNKTLTNLLNKNNMTIGKILNGNGEEADHSGGSYTNDYIYLKAGESVILNFATYITIIKYSTSKTFISTIIVNNEDKPFIFTPNENCYLRFNVYVENLDSAMVIKGRTLPSKYISYGERIPHPSDETLSNYQNAFKVINENYITNLLNKNNMTDGKIIDANGGVIEYPAGCYTNDYLLIRNGESITINFATYLTIAKYDLNKKFITNMIVNNEDLPFIFTADNDYYLRFNVYNDKKDLAMVVKGKVLPNKYIAYGEYAMTNVVAYDRFKNVLSGNYLFVGDSICAGAGANEPGGYAKLIADKNKDMTYKNISVSGAILCRRKTGDTGSTVLEQIENETSLNNVYNHVVLEGGINDIWNMDKYPVGTFDKYNRNSVLDENTICGAFESIIRKSKNAWNDAVIYYIIPHLMSAELSTPVFDKLIEICKKYAVIVIDLRYLSGEDVSIDYVKKTYTLTDGVGDGVHNNDLGYEKFYIKPIINELVKHQ